MNISSFGIYFDFSTFSLNVYIVDWYLRSIVLQEIYK